jgi:16S rRNA (cytosine1402-N4)-methyltransferase
MVTFHEPVFLKEAIEFLDVLPGKNYIDATVGGGGHTAAIISKGGIVLAIDTDPEAIDFVKKRFAAELKTQNAKLKTTRGNFKNIDNIAKENDFYPVAGVLYDLGMSSYQLEQSGRGFSFQKDESLDMRSDPDLKVTASDLVNGLTEAELTKLLAKYGEETHAHKIAGAVIRYRWEKPIRTSRELADIVVQVVRESRKIHPATKTFQALRIAVNDELNNLQSSLPQAFGLLEPKGRLVVISFHSLEDRIVKDFF